MVQHKTLTYTTYPPSLLQSRPLLPPPLLSGLHSYEGHLWKSVISPTPIEISQCTILVWYMTSRNFVLESELR